MVNSFETMERQIKEFERPTSIDITQRENASKDDEFNELNVFDMDEKDSTERRR